MVHTHEFAGSNPASATTLSVPRGASQERRKMDASKVTITLSGDGTRIAADVSERDRARMIDVLRDVAEELEDLPAPDEKYTEH